MHDLLEMLNKAKHEAGLIDIPLDLDICLKQVQNFELEDNEIREGFIMVFNEFKELF